MKEHYDLASLEEAVEQVHQVARGMGLEAFPIHYEVVPATIMYEFGAYLLPGRFSHWTHGKAYHQMKTSYDYGLSKIYELVINTNPAYAFLLESNSLLQNKFIAAHVFAHVDFFKHNAYFDRTTREMIETAALNADRIRHYEFEHGEKEVEHFLDKALSIAEHVDPSYRRPTATSHRPEKNKSKLTAASPYDDLFKPLPAKPETAEPRRFPVSPQEDLLQFLIDFSTELDDWQKDILSIIRSESLYFWPQRVTKIMNEGWASFWHLRIMRELPLTDSEFTEFAKMHSGVVVPSPTRLNPYYLGLKIFEDIEKQHGRDSIFEVREIESDVSFIRNHLNEELCKDLDLYAFSLEDDEWKVSEKQWERVRDALCNSLASGGVPRIMIEDANYNRSHELYMKHITDGRNLDRKFAEQTLIYLEELWGHPCHLETEENERKLVLTSHGGKIAESH